VRHDIFIAVPVTTDDHWLIDQPVPVADVPPQLLQYTLPSRYCDSDRLMNFAQQQFGNLGMHFTPLAQRVDSEHGRISANHGGNAGLVFD
jgi:hypothetical protein